VTSFGRKQGICSPSLGFGISGIHKNWDNNDVKLYIVKEKEK
jgi:hypothetical protein